MPKSRKKWKTCFWRFAWFRTLALCIYYINFTGFWIWWSELREKNSQRLTDGLRLVNIIHQGMVQNHQMGQIVTPSDGLCRTRSRRLGGVRQFPDMRWKATTPIRSFLGFSGRFRTISRPADGTQVSRFSQKAICTTLLMVLEQAPQGIGGPEGNMNWHATLT